MNLTATNKVLIQGISELSEHNYLAQMQAYGTNLAAIVTPGQGGTTLGGVPVFDLVEQAVTAIHNIDITLIFSPAHAVLDAALEAIDGGIRQIIIITGGIPPLDIVRLLRKARATATIVIGPGSLGMFMSDRLLLGIQNPHFFSPGGVAIVSCSSGLTHEIALTLTQAGLGVSLSLDLGRDNILGTDFYQCLEFLQADPGTEVILLLDHSNSGNNNLCLDSRREIDKPIIAYVAGHLLPGEKQVPEIGSLIASQFASTVATTSNAKLKINNLKQAKIPVADYPQQIPDLIKKALLLRKAGTIKPTTAG